MLCQKCVIFSGALNQSLSIAHYVRRSGGATKGAPMGFGILLISGVFGFLAAVFSGLVLGLSWIESFGVYWAAGLVVAITIFTARGLFCAATRQFA